MVSAPKTTTEDRNLASTSPSSQSRQLEPVLEDGGDYDIADGSMKNDDDEDDDELSKSSHFSSTAHKESTKQRAAKLERERLAKSKETKAVFWLRIVCFTILLATSILVSSGVYLYTTNDEYEDFQQVYDASAERVIDSFHDSVANLLAGVDSFSVAITSHALSTGATFPNVSMPDMELRGANTRIISKSIASTWFPLVSDEDRLGWEAYALETHQQQMVSFKAENSYIINQDEMFGLETTIKIPAQGTTKSEERVSGGESSPSKLQSFPLKDKPFSPVLTTLQGQIQPNNTGPYLPFWQTSPALPLPALASTNILSFPALAHGVQKVLETNQAYLSNAINPLAMFGMFLERGQYRHQQEAFQGDAATPLVYPVFDSFDISSRRRLVGVTLSNIYWRLHFERVLPPNARGVIAVLKNNVNQSFTYQLDGPVVTFLGRDDLHDEQFDSMRWSADITQFMEEYSSPETQGYTAVPLMKDGVQYSLHIYPSQDMKEDFVTNQPAIYAALVAMVFAFTSCFFVLYNCLVERRQRVVMDRAVKSTAVVSSLFPETVKERLINDDADELSSAVANSNKSSRRKPASWKVKERYQHHLNDAESRSSISDLDSPRPKGRPIAEKFDDTTVMFADIAGFTSWSSHRDPEQVFELLETLYGAFDRLATARRVFKVETIGDCYLAITGCPSPQEDHAIRMAKFARDCMFKVRDLTDVLAESLGDDTRSLSFRVGLHSGSVTAGVLRGDRTRFQLFGDSVNTAARMESHGVKGRIHISQATFDAICQVEGRSRTLGWVIPRKERVRAKGKGELPQTYFMAGTFMRSGKLTPSTTLSASSRSLTSSQDVDYTECDLTESEFTERNDTIMESTEFTHDEENASTSNSSYTA